MDCGLVICERSTFIIERQESGDKAAKDIAVTTPIEERGTNKRGSEGKNVASQSEVQEDSNDVGPGFNATNNTRNNVHDDRTGGAVGCSAHASRTAVDSGAYDTVAGGSTVWDPNDLEHDEESEEAAEAEGGDSGGPLATQYVEDEVASSSQSEEVYGSGAMLTPDNPCKRRRDEGDVAQNNGNEVVGETDAQIDDTLRRYERLRDKCRKTARGQEDIVLRVAEKELEQLAQTDIIWDWRVVSALGSMLKEIDEDVSEIPEDCKTIAEERMFLLKGAVKIANHEHQKCKKK